MRKILAMAAGAVLAASIQVVPAGAEEMVRFYDPATGGFEYIKKSPSRRSPENPVKREVVNYDGPYAPGTIVIDTEERRLYFVQANGKALKYGIGVGRPGFTWAGTHRITRKAETTSPARPTSATRVPMMMSQSNSLRLRCCLRVPG